MKHVHSLSDKTAEVSITLLLLSIAMITLYPFLFVLSMSFSSGDAILQQKVWLWPVGFSLKIYKEVLTNNDIGQSYYNTIWYTFVGTVISIMVTMMTAYPLSRRKFVLRKVLMVGIVFTMLFSGGLIPKFILINKIGLYNTRWAIVIPTAAKAFQIIIARVFIETTIPDSLPESAHIDGASDIHVFFRIVMPLCKPIIAVLVVFAAVEYWNQYFQSLIYQPNSDLHPITMLLRGILIMNQQVASFMEEGALEQMIYTEKIKYATIVITILPIVFVYPFIQKHFIKGFMLGAIKA